MGTAPESLPQPVSGMLDPDISLDSISDPWEQRVVAISLVSAILATGKPPDLIYPRTPDSFSNRLPSADEFRKQYLPQGALLEPQHVDGWIREQAMRDGAPSWWFVDVWVQPEEVERQERDGVILAPGTKLHFEPPLGWTRQPTFGAPSTSPMEPRFVEYATPLSARQQQAVRAGGALDTLRLLSLYFRNRWKWTPEQGATFVLTGLVPYAGEIAEHIAIQHGRRPRPMSLKHLELAVFHTRHTGESLALRMAQWNEQHPDWAYESADQFSSDSARAYRRMTATE